ncbi:helix-turn-helix domain-containing protein [Paracoccus sp. S1E-3]|uniref:helix-turn-helix domain-containing protein n=1 Tax=Paracoccus sp. S1E-3 TaxID=2756130 RepID=UPI001C689DA3|nr:helix-turn-helix transcriptional regulator [Paracoccus sp. S1E-3]
MKFLSRSPPVQLADIGARLEICRHELGLTQTEFAKVLGVSQSSYYAYEQGGRAVPIQALAALALQYGVSLDWLVLGIGPEARRDDVRASERFREELDSYLNTRSIRMSHARRTAIVDRWHQAYAAGRNPELDDLAVLIDLLGDGA